jgi:hypothetical protein
MQDFEANLISLSPASVKIDAVKAAYLAGQQSCHRSLNRWRVIAAMVALAAIAPWMMPRSKPALVAPAQIAQIAQVAISEPPVIIPIPAISEGNIWQLRQAVLDKGLDGLPRIEIAPVKPIRAFGIY